MNDDYELFELAERIRSGPIRNVIALASKLIAAWEEEFETEDDKDEEEDATLVYRDINREVIGSSSALTYGHFRQLRTALQSMNKEHR